MLVVYWGKHTTLAKLGRIKTDVFKKNCDDDAYAVADP